MKHGEAIELIRGAVAAGGGIWADLGAGGGTFTRALASLLGPEGVIYAIDIDAHALRSLDRPAGSGQAEIRARPGDFTQPLDRLHLPRLNGVLAANALHYVPYADQPRVLGQMAGLVDAPGTIVIVEYERRSANRWVPYPISFEPLRALASEVGLSDPTRLASRPSRYDGAIYSAIVRVR